MWAEVLLVVLIAPALELLLTYLLDKFDFRWNPFVKEYEELQRKGDTDCFSMTMEPSAKGGLWVGIICFGISIAIAISSSVFMLYDDCEPNFTMIDFVIFNLMLHLPCTPLFLLFLHHGTKKIYISKDQIVEKSLLVRKYIKIADISDVSEDIYVAGSSKGRLTNSDILLIRTNKKKIKVTSLYCNYERLKRRLL